MIFKILLKDDVQFKVIELKGSKGNSLKNIINHSIHLNFSSWKRKDYFETNQFDEISDFWLARIFRSAWNIHESSILEITNALDWNIANWKLQNSI